MLKGKKLNSQFFHTEKQVWQQQSILSGECVGILFSFPETF